MTKSKVCIIIVLATMATVFSFKTINIPTKNEKKHYIYYVVSKYKNQNLLLKMIYEESRFNQYAVSNKGALGLMQIMPNVWGKKLKELGIIKNVSDLFKVEENIKSGHYILTYYKEKSKTWKEAIRKYRGYKCKRRNK